MNIPHRARPIAGAPHPAPPKVSVVPPRGLATPRQPEAAAAGRKVKRRIKLLVVDDHPVVRKGISSCLAHHPNFDVVGEAGDGQAALNKARELAPDIALLDLDLPQMDGLAVTEVLRREQPNVKVLILSMHSNSEYVMRTLRSGARGYLLKGASPEELVQAIETVEAGETFFSPEIARLALDQFVRAAGEKPPAELTTREREVVLQIADGLSNKEIASHLGVGVRTVETHRARIMRKLNIHSIAGLTKYAIAKGWVILRH